MRLTGNSLIGEGNLAWRVTFPEEVAVHSRERWRDVRAWTLARMGPFRDVLQPHIDTFG